MCGVSKAVIQNDLLIVWDSFNKCSVFFLEKSSLLYFDTGNGHQCQRKISCSLLSYHHRWPMLSVPFLASLLYSLMSRPKWFEIWFCPISIRNSANFDRTFCYCQIVFCSVCTADQVQKKPAKHTRRVLFLFDAFDLNHLPVEHSITSDQYQGK